MARSYAQQSGVNLWFAEGPSGFTLLARFRAAERGQPELNKDQLTDPDKIKPGQVLHLP